jgi:histone-lysine N-methyltransferase SETMAR
MDVKDKQRTVIEFLLLEGCSGDEITIRLKRVYGSAAYCRASVFRWINEVRRGNEELRNEGRPGRPYRYETDAAIRSILREDPNASLRMIAETLSISPETVRAHMSRIGYVLKSLRWIPHALTSELKQVRLTMCLQLLPKLRAHAHNNWRYLVTGDESWFYHEYVRDRIWTARDENTPEVENRTVASRKSMLTVLWNPHGFHVVTMLPPRASFTAPWLIDGNLVPLLDKFFPTGWSPGQRKLVVHIDNAAVHNSKMTQNFFDRNPLKRLPHPPYSPDISPSDFYLFGKVKRELIGREIPEDRDLLEAVIEILNGISTDELQRVFRSWIERVEKVIAAEGDYLLEYKFSRSLFHSKSTPLWLV